MPMACKNFYEARHEYNCGLFEYGPYEEFDASVARNRDELARTEPGWDIGLFRKSEEEEILEEMEADKNKRPPYGLETFTY